MKPDKGQGPLATAVRLLAGRDHSEQELREKLTRGRVPDAEIAETVSVMRERGYLNDEALKLRKMERLIVEGRYGLHGVVDKLRRQGLTVSAGEVRSRYPEQAEFDAALCQLNRHFGQGGEEDLPRAFRFLANRGYSADMIRRAVEEWLKHQ